MRAITWALAITAACTILLQAHNPGWDVPTPGVPGAAIVINGTEGAGEWAGAAVFSINEGVGDPLTASVKALVKADGLYILATITDSVFNASDGFNLRFDITHNGGMTTEATDWGAQILRNGQITWGAANLDPSAWGAAPAGTAGVVSNAANWIVEFKLPTGPPSNLALATGQIGGYFSLYDADLAFDPTGVKYTQWPAPPALSPNDLLDGNPSQWGHITFNPATTFPNLSVNEVRRDGVAAESYYKISHTAENQFVVRVTNPGGTAIADATNVRVNLYLAARGIGEPWHRLDAGALMDSDCAAPAWPFQVLPEPKVCTGNNSLADIESKTLAEIVGNIADYTIKSGVSRLGGENITVTGGSNPVISVLQWNTTPDQDQRFTEVVVGGNTYRRQHACMRAEVTSPNDPNLSDNQLQVNMDFVCVPGAQQISYMFSAGWAGFGQYDPRIGRQLFLQIVRRNMDEGWRIDLQGAKQLQGDRWVADISGTLSRALQANITAPNAERFGRVLKENALVAPGAGGNQSNASRRSGTPPFYVKVDAGATLRVVNYAFDDNDEQSVDLDGQLGLPPNGPAGLSDNALQRSDIVKDPALQRLVSNARIGALVGSFDNFRTGFLVGEGVQVRVPANATHLALGINDVIGQFDDNAGTGFRVKVTVAAGAGGIGLLRDIEDRVVPAVHAQQELAIVPIADVMPTVCVNGYEDSGNVRSIQKTKHKMFRYIGNVCWAVLNVHAPDRPRTPEMSDPFEDGGGGVEVLKWWWILVVLILIALIGLVLKRRRHAMP